jgi:hypothetical protein
MTKAIRPDELERMKGEVDAAGEQAARGAAREKLNRMIPFEPSPDDQQPQAHINLPNDTRARLRPSKADPIDVDIDATGSNGASVDVPKITGKPANPDGSVTVDPRDVIDTIGKIGGIDMGKATTFATRTGHVAGMRGAVRM